MIQQTPLETVRSAIELIHKHDALHLTKAEKLAKSYGHPIEVIEGIMVEVRHG